MKTYIILLSLLLSQTVIGQHLMIDSTYGIQNLARVPIDVMGSEPIVNADASLFVPGFVVDSNGAILTVVKLTSEGQVDSTFATNGVFQLPAPYTGRTCFQVLRHGDDELAFVLADGSKRIVVGFDRWGNQKINFGTQGELEVGHFDGFEKVMTTSEGKLIVYSYYEGDVIFRRYTLDGQLDGDFGNNGKVWYWYGPGNRIKLARPSRDGGIVVAGNEANMMQYGLLIIKFDNKGSVNMLANYYPNGPWNECVPNQVYELRDGGFMVEGSTYVQDTSTFNWNFSELFIARIDRYGDPETSFGNNGYMPATNFAMPTFLLGRGRFVSVWDNPVLVDGSGTAGRGYVKMLPSGECDSAYFQNADFGDTNFRYMRSVVFRDSCIYAFGSFINGQIGVGKFGPHIPHVPQLPLGVHIIRPNVEVQVFPNPANETAAIAAEGLEGADVQLHIWSTTGGLVYSARVSVHSGEMSTTVPVTRWASGNYLVSLRSGTSIRKGWLIKN